MRIRVLGCGHSGGTPMIGAAVGGDWGACDPKNPRNRRLRPSILVEEGASTLLVDTSPDLRQQLLEAEVSSLDAVLFTHGHADHLHGIDDLRAVNRAMEAALPGYADAATWRAIEQRFGYTLTPLPEGSDFYFKPCIEVNALEHGQTITIGEVAVTAFRQDHGFSESLGLRMGRFAYSTDIKRMPDESLAFLDGIEVWIVDALSDRPNPVHFTVEEATAQIERIAPGRAYLTHLSHHLDYAALSKRLPDGVEPAHDGLVIELD